MGTCVATVDLTPQEVISREFVKATFKQLLMDRPCDNSIVIKHRTRFRGWVEFDLFQLDAAVNNRNNILKWQSSTFCDMLLRFLEIPCPQQKKNERLEVLCQILGISKSQFYSIPGQAHEGTASTSRFLMLVGTIAHYYAYNNLPKDINPILLEYIGFDCFDSIVTYLDNKYGDDYDKGRKLPRMRTTKGLTVDLVEKYPEDLGDLLLRIDAGDSNRSISEDWGITTQAINKLKLKALKFHEMVLYLRSLHHENKNVEKIARALLTKYPRLEQISSKQRNPGTEININSVFRAAGITEINQPVDVKAVLDTDSVVDNFNGLIKELELTLPLEDVITPQGSEEFHPFLIEEDIQSVSATYLWAMDILLSRLIQKTLSDVRDNSALYRIKSFKSKANYRQPLPKTDKKYWFLTIDSESFYRVFGVYTLSLDSSESWRLNLQRGQFGGKLDQEKLLDIGNRAFLCLLNHLDVS
jgi:hypothetical protein